MLASASAMAFVASTDLVRSRDFYERTLGLLVIEIDDYACVVQSAGTTIRIAKVEGFHPQPFTVLGWIVTDLRARVRGLDARGVRMIRYEEVVQDPDGVWTTPGGDQIAWFKDPDGNVLSMTQSATEVAV